MRFFTVFFRQPTELSNLEQKILDILKHREYTALQILDRLNSNAKFSKVGFGRLYPALHKLQSRKFIACRWDSDRCAITNCRRKYYYLVSS